VGLCWPWIFAILSCVIIIIIIILYIQFTDAVLRDLAEFFRESRTKNQPSADIPPDHHNESADYCECPPELDAIGEFDEHDFECSQELEAEWGYEEEVCEFDQEVEADYEYDDDTFAALD
jgi:hypothetical protein